MSSPHVQQPWRAHRPRTGPGPYAVVDGRVLTDGVEIVVTHHCNLRCRACAYLSPVRPPTFARPDGLRDDLAVLRRYYHVTEARVLGGEPLLHPRLIEVLEIIRDAGISDSIRVISNGLLLGRQEPAFWRAIDAVSVSMYPGRALNDTHVREARQTAERFGVRINFKPFRFFRESYSESGTSNAALINRIFRTCQMLNVWRCHTLWAQHLYRCPQSLFLPAELGDDDATAVDAFALTERPAFLTDLVEFLESDEPLWSCTHCLGSVGMPFPTTQIPRRDWRQAQTRLTEELVDWEHLTLLERNPGMFVPDASYMPVPPGRATG